MDSTELRRMLAQVAAGQLSPDAALDSLRWQPMAAVDDFAQIDYHRPLRQGMPEFVYAEGKTPDQTARIMAALHEKTGAALASRANVEQYRAIVERVPDAIYNQPARLVTIGKLPLQEQGQALIVAAGTSDLPVAEEAAGVLRFLGTQTETLYDVGVAGLHRLLAHATILQRADVLIVVAGMEGALPTLVTGLVAAPVIAVPTSIGYGANFGGLSALLGMLTSCATGLSVVNIDNGLGAAAAAQRILNRLRWGTAQ